MSRADTILEYFNQNADTLAQRFNATNRVEVHADLLSLISDKKGLRILDAGAGSGADAAMFAALDHRVVAAEPAKKLRAIARKEFKDSRIRWSADKLPALEKVKGTFDVVTLSAVIQFLDRDDRYRALKRALSLVNENGLVEIQYPVKAQRRYQYNLSPHEIENDLEKLNNQKRATSSFEIVVDRTVADTMGRKLPDNSPLMFRTLILKRTR